MKTVCVLLLCLGLVGCATGYHSNGFTGGFTEMKLQDNVYRIGFQGNGYTGEQRAADFTLLRSAELTLESGYRYFVVLANGASVQTAVFTTPVTSQTTGNVAGGTYSGATTYSGGETNIVNKPSSNMTIQCFKEKPLNIGGMIYDAEQIKANLRKAYGLK